MDPVQHSYLIREGVFDLQTGLNHKSEGSKPIFSKFTERGEESLNPDRAIGFKIPSYRSTNFTWGDLGACQFCLNPGS